jgi:hypothetical protein
MSRALILVVTVAAALTACAPPPEARILGEFFNASRLADHTALQKIATTWFSPAVDGIVTSFTITGVVARQAGGRETKDVSMSAPVKLPDGRTLQKNLLVTLQRDAGASGGVAARWIVTAVRDSAAGLSIPPR